MWEEATAVKYKTATTPMWIAYSFGRPIGRVMEMHTLVWLSLRSMRGMLSPSRRRAVDVPPRGRLASVDHDLASVSGRQGGDRRLAEDIGPAALAFPRCYLETQ